MGWGHLSSLTAAPSGAHLRPPSPLGFYDMHGAQAAPCHSCWAMVRSGVAVTCEVAVQHDAEEVCGAQEGPEGAGRLAGTQVVVSCLASLGSSLRFSATSFICC